MKSLIKKILRYVQFPFIVSDYLRFRRNMQGSRFAVRLADVYPCIKDKTIQTGFDRHYVYHTSWAARVLAEAMPTKHIDISSSLYFSGIVSAFIPVDFYDFRPADITLSELRSKQGDITKLPFADNSQSSLSCMHVIEHIGLGRYGDPIDSEGDIKSAAELSRNAHRIYTYELVQKLFPTLTLKEFTLIPEHSGDMIRNADPSLAQNEHYACGCFVFTK